MNFLAKKNKCLIFFSIIKVFTTDMKFEIISEIMQFVLLFLFMYCIYYIANKLLLQYIPMNMKFYFMNLND